MKKYMILAMCFTIVLTISGCLAASGLSNMDDGTTGTDDNTLATTIPPFSSCVVYPTIETVASIPEAIASEPSATETMPDMTAPETTSGSSDNLAAYFDFAQSHKPTEDDIQQVADAMPSADVIALLGKPHAGGPTSGRTSLAWQTDEGNWYYIVFVYEGGAPENTSTLDRIFYHSLCSPAREMSTFADE